MTKYFVRSDDIIAFPIHNGISLHNLNDDTYYSLPEGTSTYIWDSMDGSKTVEEIVNELAQLCGCSPEAIMDDITAFVDSLLENALIYEVKRKEQVS